MLEKTQYLILTSEPLGNITSKRIGAASLLRMDIDTCSTRSICGLIQTPTFGFAVCRALEHAREKKKDTCHFGILKLQKKIVSNNYIRNKCIRNNYSSVLKQRVVVNEVSIFYTSEKIYTHKRSRSVQMGAFYKSTSNILRTALLESVGIWSRCLATIKSMS